jgi:glycosyltransferase involved in cell wall biosynthesis
VNPVHNGEHQNADGGLHIAAVVIGRNEGERLERCLESLADLNRIVYVDSGSTDGSVEMARGRGVEVVELDLSRKFTAARARNAGLDQLRAQADQMPDFVQFVDGDCEVQPDWVERAVSFLKTEPKAAVVCGRRRERFPDASVYNAQCDREWETPVGPAKACGGDALMRLTALDEVGGYDPTLIAGEEPEMCVRLRGHGWTVYRLEVEMTLHDAAMTTFAQFWKRARRAGHAYAEGAFMHGRAPEFHFVSETRRAVLWGACLPLIIVLAGLVSWIGFALILIYPLQIARMAKRGGFTRTAWEEAALLTASKGAEALGVAEFHMRRLAGRESGLIEYK